MSQDLFDAFTHAVPPKPSGSVAQNSLPVANASDPFSFGWNDSAASKVQVEQHSSAEQDDDEEFGDFEDASIDKTVPKQPPQQTVSTQSHSLAHRPAAKAPTAKPTARSNIPVSQKPIETSKTRRVGDHPFAGHMDLLFEGDDDEYDAGADDLNKDLSTDPQAAMEWSKRVIMEQEKQNSRSSQQSRGPPNANAKVLPKKQRDENVLFDAEDLSEPDNNDEDDFDDFQSFQPTQSLPTSSSQHVTSSKPTQGLVDLLDLDESHHSSDAKPPISKNPISGSKQKVHTSTEPAFVDDDGAEWDDFEDAMTPSNQPPPSDPVMINIDLSAFEPAYMRSITNIASTEPHDSLPPTNVPPPVLLLSLFQPILNSARNALFDPFSRLPSEQRHLLLAQPVSQKFVQSMITVAFVLGHVIAGRKLRWKRDQILAQSMRIGASGKGGMKLAGLERGEVVKEDREVLDIVRIWKQHVGRFKSTVAAIGRDDLQSAAAKTLNVPEISEAMPVKALKAAEGGITATRQCALCGLKREERVAKVDVDIDDSFGEWWLERSNMHTQCWKFWECQKGNLHQR